MFGGIGGKERSWEDTKVVLAKKLHSLEVIKVSNVDDQYLYDDFYDNIVRAHRGGKGKKDEDTIYAKFSSQSLVDHIKDLAFVKRNIYISQMRSPMINTRLYNGRNLIRTLRNNAESKSWKMFMNDKCQLMHKKPDSDKYIMYKQF